jgi:hypothetical protein
VILPLANLIIALALLYWNRAGGLLDLRPMFLCQWINAPATLAHKAIVSLWKGAVVSTFPTAGIQRFDGLFGVANVGLYLILIVISWYIVGLECDNRDRGKPVIVPASQPQRAIAGVVLVSIGILIGLGEVARWSTDYWSMWVFLRAILRLSWTLAFLTVYGRDLLGIVVKNQAVDSKK